MNSQYPNNPETVSGAVKASDVENKSYEKDLWAVRITEIPDNMTKRFEYDASNNCIYLGAAPRGLAEGTDGWLLKKFTYDGSNNCTKIEIGFGNWTNRASEAFA
jgi:hypothetical protein